MNKFFYRKKTQYISASVENGVAGLSRSPRHYYGKEERPNTGLAEISLLPAEGNRIKIIKDNLG